MRWVLFVFAVIASGVFYWLRSRNRILYGTIEITVGLVIFLILFKIIPTATLLAADDMPGLGWLVVSNTVGFFTGVYAIVRGLDNIITELRS
jgi:uncharacterized membrane protein HdeD (DUF308 family)